MVSLKVAGAVALLAVAPVLTSSIAEARVGGGHGGGGFHGGGGLHGGGAAFRGGGANFAARTGGTGTGFAARSAALSGTGRTASFARPGIAAGTAVAATQSGIGTGSHRYWNGRRWIGPGIGFAAGVAAGAALGSPYYDGGYYGDGYYADNYDSNSYYGNGYYGGGYPNGSYGDSYAYDTGSDVSSGDGQPTGGDTAAYCQQRYRSYDLSSGTYLGYDGMRHPCL